VGIGDTTVQNTHIRLQFNDQAQRPHVAQAVSRGGHDWHLSATIDGQTFTKHCSSWQGVERTMSWLRRHAHEPLPVEEHSAWRQSLVALLVVAVWLSSAALAGAQTSPPYSQPVNAFLSATHDYAQTHRRLERHIGQFDINTPIDSINRMIQQLATAIRAERPGARQGEFFTPALSAELRASIARSLRDHGFTAADVRDAARVDRIDYSRIELRVNDTFPWVLGVSMFACLIDALPPLPPELQYRIVGDDLLLIDVHASLIVDILRSALAPETTALR
jgi:hypothetical protein